MKSFLPLLSLAVVFASCTTAYKSGQTPDDVYFSPERPREEYVRVEKREDRKYQGQDYYSYEDDRYLRMRVRNRNQWSYLDDYYRDPYAYNYYSYNRNYYYDYNGYWNPRTYWNCYYNPYAPKVIVSSRTPVYNKPRTYNLHVFDNPQDNSNPKTSNTRSRQYAYPSEQIRTSNDVGNGLRNVFGNSGNNSSNRSSNSTNSSNTTSGNTSESKSSSGSSNSGGNAPVRRF